MNNQLLIADRECGECTVCCVELTIEDQELVKLPGIKCKNLLKKGGCSIYQNRPNTCKSWYCMWRFLPLLDDQWRPDLKGILISRVFDNIPEKYSDKIALEFSIIGKRSVISDIQFIEVLCGYIVSGFPCFISYGTAGKSSRKQMLNDLLLPAIENRDFELIKKKISQAFMNCVKHPKNKMKIKNGKIVIIS